MSSLAAARADNFYFPPDYDPSKGSLNTQQGQHALRERAKKLDQGILVIRFEMPFNVWCAGCNHLIGKGVRFNAEKKQVGSYFSTKIWSFSMNAPCCGQRIEVQTDPKNTEYVVVSGGRRKAETWTAEDAQTLELPEKEDSAVPPALDDPFYRLEHKDRDKKKGRELNERVAELWEDSDAKYRDDYALNKALRRNNRAKRKEEKQLEVKRKALGLADGLLLLPEAEEDSVAASLVQFGDPQAFTKKWQQKRRAIRNESIFAPSAMIPFKSKNRVSIQGAGGVPELGSRQASEAQVSWEGFSGAAQESMHERKWEGVDDAGSAGEGRDRMQNGAEAQEGAFDARFGGAASTAHLKAEQEGGHHEHQGVDGGSGWDKVPAPSLSRKGRPVAGSSLKPPLPRAKQKLGVAVGAKSSAGVKKRSVADMAAALAKRRMLGFSHLKKG